MGDMRIMAGKGNANRRMGAFWERQAAEYLEQKGYQILERNFCSYFGEIDIIARQGDYLVFVEVKYRREGSPVHALESVDSGKRRRICKTAAYYCLRCGWPEDTPCRFDILGIQGGAFAHIEYAFPYI